MYSIRLIVSLQSKQVNMTKPLILISNDDGYHSRGLRYLCEFLSDMADILVCAPESPRSGYSCAFSAEPPIYLKRRKKIVGAEVWSCSGTPADCVKIALDRLTPHRRPDMVIGGINHGDNSTVNTHYSGTMGVAMEGCMKYIPSIAFSSCDYDPDADLSHLRDGVRMIVQRVLSDGLPKGVCLNVNFPKVDHLRELRFVVWVMAVGPMRFLSATIHARENTIGWWATIMMTSLARWITIVGHWSTDMLPSLLQPWMSPHTMCLRA